MKKRMKKVISLLLAATLVMSIAGCAGGSGEEDSSKGDDGKIKIVFAEHVADVKNQAPQVYSVVQSYMEEHPNVEIEIQGTEIDEHINK